MVSGLKAQRLQLVNRAKRVKRFKASKRPSRGDVGIFAIRRPQISSNTLNKDGSHWLFCSYFRFVHQLKRNCMTECSYVRFVMCISFIIQRRWLMDNRFLTWFNANLAFMVISMQLKIDKTHMPKHFVFLRLVLTYLLKLMSYFVHSIMLQYKINNPKA